MDTPAEGTTTLTSTDAPSADDPHLAFALGKLVGAVEEATRPVPGTAVHSTICICWSCRLRKALDFYWQQVDAAGRYFPGGPPIGS